ncbi:hypothetical protein Xoosp13_83 [Xanthomonas phage Xoo-sp13]|nr:hypothetical protein Xoosp13_83 [Xanthomonas phage Xoo-sp13]
MGYYKDNQGIDCFSPDNTENTLYIEIGNGEKSADALTESIHEHFGDIGNAYSISAEKIHTRCLGYDLYDSSDYDMFLIITKD